MEFSHYYLVRVQYLGFRFSGWQKQPGQKTVEAMLLKTLKFVLPDRELKILGASRTDAKVSALDGAFEIFLNGDPIDDLNEFIKAFNDNLPADIKAIKIDKVNKKFNIIKDAASKEYVYLFSSGSKNHPCSAPFIAGFTETLDIDLMKAGAQLFEGSHNFKAYTVKSVAGSRLVRRVDKCEIAENDLLKANFFPQRSYALTISASGFLRYQVRMIMGALVLLGKHELSMDDIRASLKANSSFQLAYVAPASGLMLSSLSFEELA